VATNSNFIKQCLPAALGLLLLAVFLPGSNQNLSVKALSVAETTPSLLGLQNEPPSGSGAKDQKFSRTAAVSIPVPSTPYRESLPIPAQGPDSAFTLSQARAPPVS